VPGQRSCRFRSPAEFEEARIGADVFRHSPYSSLMVAWARSLLDSGGFCVLDPENTDLKPPVVFLEVAIVDAGARTHLAMEKCA
jgi:hypothetical protein